MLIAVKVSAKMNPIAIPSHVIDDICNGLPYPISLSSRCSEAARLALQAKIALQLDSVKLVPVEAAYNTLKKRIYEAYRSSFVVDGEMVGSQASESASSGAFQMTMDSFSVAGTEQEISASLDALVSLLTASKRRKDQKITVHFNPNIAATTTRRVISADQLEQGYVGGHRYPHPHYTKVEIADMRSSMVQRNISHFIKHRGITVGVLNFDSDSTELAKHKEMASTEYNALNMKPAWWHSVYMKLSKFSPTESVFVLRLYLDVEMLYAYDVTPTIIVNALRNWKTSSPYTDDYVVAMCSPITEGILDIFAGPSVGDISGMTKINTELTFLNDVIIPSLRTIRATGIPGLKTLSCANIVFSNMITFETQVTDGDLVKYSGVYVDHVTVSMLRNNFGVIASNHSMFRERCYVCKSEEVPSANIYGVVVLDKDDGFTTFYLQPDKPNWEMILGEPDMRKIPITLWNDDYPDGYDGVQVEDFVHFQRVRLDDSWRPIDSQSFREVVGRIFIQEMVRSLVISIAMEAGMDYDDPDLLVSQIGVTDSPSKTARVLKKVGNDYLVHSTEDSDNVSFDTLVLFKMLTRGMSAWIVHLDVKLIKISGLSVENLKTALKEVGARIVFEAPNMALSGDTTTGILYVYSKESPMRMLLKYLEQEIPAGLVETFEALNYTVEDPATLTFLEKTAQDMSMEYTTAKDGFIIAKADNERFLLATQKEVPLPPPELVTHIGVNEEIRGMYDIPEGVAERIVQRAEVAVEFQRLPTFSPLGVAAVSESLARNQRDPEIERLKEYSYAIAECETIQKKEVSTYTNVLSLPWVNKDLTIYNDIHVTAATLGIEASRNLFVREFHTILKLAQASVSNRHITLIADDVTSYGVPLGAGIAGTRRKNMGVFSQAALKKAADVLIASPGKSESTEHIVPRTIMGAAHVSKGKSAEHAQKLADRMKAMNVIRTRAAAADTKRRTQQTETVGQFTYSIDDAATLRIEPGGRIAELMEAPPRILVGVEENKFRYMSSFTPLKKEIFRAEGVTLPIPQLACILKIDTSVWVLSLKKVSIESDSEVNGLFERSVMERSLKVGFVTHASSSENVRLVDTNKLYSFLVKLIKAEQPNLSSGSGSWLI